MRRYEDGAGARRRVAVVPALLGIAVLGTFVATAVLVVSYESPVPAAAAPTSSAARSSQPVSPAVQPFTFPDLRSAPLGDAVAGLEAAGAEVTSFDARWERAVQPDWTVCTQTQLFLGDVASDRVHLAAVPAGDPCP